MKRFTDSQRFEKSWYRRLPQQYKLLWEYVLAHCDTCGVWQVEFDVAVARIGCRSEELNEEDAISLFNEEKKRIHVLKEKEKWLVLDFINFQYGALKSNARNASTRGVHRGIIKLLEQHGLIEFYNFEYGTFERLEEYSKNSHRIPYCMTINSLQEKDKEKDKDKDKEKDNSASDKKTTEQQTAVEEIKEVAVIVEEKPKKKRNALVLCEIDEAFREAFEKWLQYKREKGQTYKSKTSQKTCYKHLLQYAHNDPQTAMRVVDRSISNNWAGLFQLDNNQDEQRTELERRADEAAKVYAGFTAENTRPLFEVSDNS